MSTVIARTVTKAVLPLILMTSIALLLQGHNLPGGGFIAGVLTAVGIGLVYIMFSIDYVESTIFGKTKGDTLESLESSVNDNYRDIFGLGLLVAVITGLAALFFDLPFLTQDFWIFHWPIYTEMHIASAFIFDIGVYFVVVGALLTIISAVGRE